MLWSLKRLKFNRRFFVKRRHFKFGGKFLANVLLRCTRANTFLTLTDIKNQVIISKSAGSCGIIGRKKKKISPYVIESMVNYLTPYLRLYNIKQLNLIFKSKSRSFFPFLIKNLHMNGLTINDCFDRYRVAHNGVRLGKAPRK